MVDGLYWFLSCMACGFLQDDVRAASEPAALVERLRRLAGRCGVTDLTPMADHRSPAMTVECIGAAGWADAETARYSRRD